MTGIPDGLREPGPSPAPPSSAPFRLIPSRLASPTSVGDAVYDQILEALQQGRLQPGERLRDGEFAAQLGVSRTPVREALLRLGELGVVEFAPARYTRVAIIDRTQTGQAIAAWVTVYAAIAALAASSGVPAPTLRAMADAHARFHAASDPYDFQALSTANAEFYDEPTKHCDNPILVRCADRSSTWCVSACSNSPGLSTQPPSTPPKPASLLPCPPPTPAPPDGPSTASPKSRSNPATPTAPARDGAGHDAAAFSRTAGRLGRSWRRRSDCRFILADSENGSAATRPVSATEQHSGRGAPETARVRYNRAISAAR